MKKIKKGIKLIEVTWEDHWLSSADWTTAEMFDEGNRLYCQSVGYLVAEDKKHLYISSQLQPICNGSYRGVNSIIKSCVKKIRVLGVR